MKNVKTSPVRVLITSAGATTAMSVMKSLRASKRLFSAYIVATDIYDKYEIPSGIFCDVIYKVPSYSDKSYISTLMTICKKEKVDLVIPIVDQEVEIIAKNADIFLKNNIRVACSDYRVVKACNDKYSTYITLAEKGVVTPRVYLENEINELKSLTGPFYVKPRIGCSSIDCYRVNSWGELSVVVERIKKPIIQRLLKGKQYVIDIINDQNGKNIVAIPRHEITAKAGIGVKAVTEKNLELIEYAKEVSEALQIKGVANIEVFYDKKNISLIEINPRFSAGSILSTAAGANLAELAVSVFVDANDKYIIPAWKEGVYMTRYWQEVYFLRKSRFLLKNNV